MSERKYSIGDKIGDYEIVGYKREKNKRLKYLLKCNICGTIKEKSSCDLTKKCGITHKSCNKSKRHFDKRFWDIYSDAKRRCNDPTRNRSQYYYYKGIKFELGEYEDFHQKCYKSYIEHCEKYGVKDTTLDRIDGNKNYSYDNIRWATRREQSLNKDLKAIGKKISNAKKKISDEELETHYKLWKNKRITKQEIAKKFNVHIGTVENRFRQLNK